MKAIFLVAATLTMAAMASAQNYSPKAGESVLRVDVEGKGRVFISLFSKEAPKASSRVAGLANQGFYDGMRFHRVERSPRPFLAQLGAPSSRSKAPDDPGLRTEGTGTRIPFEDSGYGNDTEGMVGLSTLPGDRDSGDCQFYILLGPARFLNGNYTVFGKVVSGLDVLRKIELGDRVTSVKLVGQAIGKLSPSEGRLVKRR